MLFPQFEKLIFLGLPYTLFPFSVQITFYSTLLGEALHEFSGGMEEMDREVEFGD